MEKEIVFAGAHCDEKTRQCKVWWLSTIQGKTIEAEVTIPHFALINTIPEIAELKLEDIFKDSKLRIRI